VRVRAKAVIFAGGAVPTPLWLMKQGLCNSSGELGKNLTLHPSGGLSAVMDESIRGWEKIPQGYGCDEHLKDGILLTAAQPDVNYAALMFPVTGDRLMDRLAALPWTASVGLLIADSGKGRIILDAGGTGVIRYSHTQADCDRYHRAVIAMSEICFAAGARTVLPSLYEWSELGSRADLDRLRKAKLEAKHLMMTSYHPLGTAKMGRDPRTSVVDLDHQTHDVPGLYIVDGSTVSGPLGVNPQLTIMAVATRAAERIAEHLS
jgi:choline dehydrogenase-like flavoprotein